jgi:hypothetical protein
MPIVLSDNIAIDGKVVETIKSVGLTPKISAIPIRPILDPISSPSVANITIDSDYKYMSFAYTSGATQTSYTMNFQENTECDILIVGGGGSGGRSVGGGGGAGGVVYQQNVILRGNYIINVGKGGAQTINISNGVDSGNSSQILNNNNSILSINGIIYQGNGGGGGGTRRGDPPGNPDGGFDGGSGGGGSCTIDGIPVNGGNSTQGRTIRQNGININGGNNALITNITGFFGGGGGGAGGNKLNDGGDGIAIDITGINSLYAAGGGGGRISNTGAAIGGSEIGGNGVYNTSSNGTLVIPTRLNGVNGTGSGGGGGGYNYNYLAGPNGDGGGSGGSGIVIIRYKTNAPFIPIPYPISINSGYTYIPFINNTGANQTPYTITFPENTECDILVVAGGGGAGRSIAGGGGAGGLIFNQNIILLGTYNINVGRGGIGTSSVAIGENGKNSLFTGGNTLISYDADGGGGTAGQSYAYNNANYIVGQGGSGGGGVRHAEDGGIGVIGEGNNGGIGGYVAPIWGGGGGGGAGGNGGNTSSLSGGIGGVGRNMSSTFGSSLGDDGWFAGGGGGGTDNGPAGVGGKGGGGRGQMSGNYAATNGINGTGGGGGGGSGLGGNGGSGIVIIRYKIIKEPYNAQWTYSSTNPSVYHMGNVGIGTTNPTSALSVVGSVSASIGISAVSKSFKIEHPLNMNKWLYHGCVEAPRFDNIYRGKKIVTNGQCEVDIDSECNKTGGMTEGTFIALNTNSQLYLRNNQTFDGVKGSIVDGKIIINCQNTKDEIEVDWLVIGERKDENVINVPLTSIEGNLICEHNID